MFAFLAPKWLNKFPLDIRLGETRQMFCHRHLFPLCSVLSTALRNVWLIESLQDSCCFVSSWLIALMVSGSGQKYQLNEM